MICNTYKIVSMGKEFQAGIVSRMVILRKTATNYNY